MSHGIELKRPPRDRLAALDEWSKQPAIQDGTAIRHGTAIPDGNAIPDSEAIQQRSAAPDGNATRVRSKQGATVPRAAGPARQTKSSEMARKWGGASQSRTYRIPEELHVAMRGLAGTTIGMSITDLVILGVGKEVERRMKERGLNAIPDEWWSE